MEKNNNPAPPSCCSIDYAHPCHTIDGSKWGCWMRGILMSRHYWISVIVAFLVIMTFGYLWHGEVLMGEYLKTEGLWRPESEMKPELIWMQHVLQAMVYSWLVLALTRTPRWIEPIGIGMMIGAAPAVMCLMYHATIPFPDAYIPSMWAVGFILEAVLVSLAIRAVHGCLHCARNKPVAM